MKYFYFKPIIKSITASLFIVLIIEGTVIFCSSFDSFLKNIMRKEILISIFILTTIQALFLFPLFKYIEENKVTCPNCMRFIKFIKGFN
jgi:hypothetical protein